MVDVLGLKFFSVGCTHVGHPMCSAVGLWIDQANIKVAVYERGAN